MLNPARLKNSLSDDNIIHLMKLLGATQFQDRGEFIQFPTICHNEHEHHAGFNLSYYKKNKRFYCFSNCHSMDIFQVIKNRWELLDEGDDTHFNNIAFWVVNHSQLDLDRVPEPKFTSFFNAQDYTMATREIILPEKSEKVLESFTYRPCVEWLSDGIAPEAMKKYNILYSSTRNAIIIPHYDVNDRLIGVRRRALEEDEEKRGKYKPIFVQGMSYSHPLSYNLYGLNLVKDYVKKRSKIVIAEGEKAPLQSYSVYGENNYVVAACGNRINRWQIHLIMKYCNPKEIIIAFDKGLEYDYLENMCSRYLNYCHLSFTYDFNDLLKDKQSPFDNIAVLETLLKQRVRLQPQAIPKTLKETQ